MRKYNTGTYNNSDENAASMQVTYNEFPKGNIPSQKYNVYADRVSKTETLARRTERFLDLRAALLWGL